MRFLVKVSAEVITIKWLLFAVCLYYFGLNIKNELIRRSIGYELQANHWDFLISYFSDPYLIIYLIFPIWIFSSAYIIFKKWDYNLLIRLASYRDWIFYTLKEMSVILVVILIIWFITGSILSINLPFDIGWSSLSSLETEDNKYLQILNSAGINPFVILIMQIGLFLLFFLTIYMVLITSYIVFQKKILVICLSVIFFVGVIVSFKSFLDLNVIMLQNYMFLYQSYESFQTFIFSPMLLMIVIFICFFIVKIIDNSKIQSHFFLENSKYVIYILFCSIGILSPMLNFGATIETVWDNLYLRFYGLSEQGFNFNQYIFSCIVFLGFTYLFQLHLSSILSSRLYYLVIRYKSIERWFVEFIKSFILGIFVLLIVLFLITIFHGLILGQSLNLYVSLVSWAPLTQILYQFFINGFLQILNYLLIIFIISWIFKDVFYSLIAVGIILVTMVPAINVYQILPFGLNSLGYVTGDMFDLIKITSTLAIFILIEFIVIFYCFKKRDFLL